MAVLTSGLVGDKLLLFVACYKLLISLKVTSEKYKCKTIPRSICDWKRRRRIKESEGGSKPKQIISKLTLLREMLICQKNFELKFTQIHKNKLGINTA